MKAESLQSWQEIAQYLGRAERTVQRWELRFGLPVHRPLGKHRGNVVAFVHEIDKWVNSTPSNRSQL
jgi:predicted DNA-binding transcriptional regulator AlpA